MLDSGEMELALKPDSKGAYTETKPSVATLRVLFYVVAGKQLDTVPSEAVSWRSAARPVALKGNINLTFVDAVFPL
ncbi:hypothetical protein V1279_004846 [Bradyrhizobium sp. AZCC 1610]|uniref:hypothetical protein n=1 Tax=Bradyrhizobium sp. AZCC 1610 TaxID=3117020 RepID=UPI002FF34425